MKITNFINHLLNGKKICCSYWRENEYCYWNRSTNTMKNSEGNDVEWTVDQFRNEITVFNGETVKFYNVLVGTRFKFVSGGEEYTKIIQKNGFNCISLQYELNYCPTNELVLVVDVV